MNITRYNYEEYFILYVDNELSSDDRRRVEAFTALHPDLKEELEMLLQSKLIPDNHIVFESKEDLLFASAGNINHSNYEEWLVLYTDNELDTAQRKAVETFAAANPAVQQELNLLQQTIIQPELIAFPYKDSLYRREEKVRRFPAWWRVAAAAVLILAAGTTVMLVNNDNPSTEDPVALAPQTNPVNEPAIRTAEPALADATKKEQPPVTEPAVANNTSSAALAEHRPKKQTEDKQVPKKEEQVMASVEKQGGNNLPQPDQNPYVKSSTTNDVFAKAETLPKKELTNSPETKYAAPVTKEVADPSLLYATAPIDVADADESTGKKNKLRGFFRKVTRTFEKRTSIDATDGEDRLLVAGLSIKLK